MYRGIIIAVLVIILVAIIVWHYYLCHASEGLHCGCARRAAALYAWSTPGLPPCDVRYRGLMPYRHPRSACSFRAYNPFWPPYGSMSAYMVPTNRAQYIDIPISRMIGDHVPLE